MLGRQFYSTLNNLLSTTIAGTGGFNEHIQVSPVVLPERVFAQRTARLSILRAFFETTLQIFRGVIDGKYSPELSRLLLCDVPESYGIKFHQELPSEVWTIPHFFRTDEAPDGRIFEIQCPGSGWGDLQLLTNLYARHFKSEAISKYQPSELVAQEIVTLCGEAEPTVLHLLDNSSNPVSMRYLMATTQPPLHYWGYDKSVRNGKCHFVRSHSFFGLVAENLFKVRVQDVSKGLVRFDLPPILVFDQKAPLCLPFIEETRAQFPDEIRDSLVYSYPVSETGFLDHNGDWIDIDGFLKRPASQRKYFLKYAGCDVSRNWGSRSVFRLDDHSATVHLKAAAADAKRGRFWLIQPEISQKEFVTFFDNHTYDSNREKWTAKHSCFYGATSLIGIRTMHRNHFKVHGQEDTAVGIAIPSYSAGGDEP
jgi:hypothetical protein